MSDVADDEVWLTVESHKGIGGMYTYCGLGSRDELDRWRRGELRGALTLKRTYWVEEDTETGRRMPIVVGRHTSFRHGTGTVYLAAETIVLVMEMHHPDPGVLDGEEAQVVRLGAVRESRQE
ncbi:MAG: hypothetical protein H6721_31375 [Sandaracinus sp.]|nr:hypothetical protein [Sandaracinus sp.]MCB9621932.1 hypothetical protein [Sandaracinus sp.]MCB9636634.1 hypothetical protein [Sandaracinus sp.]